MVVKSENRQLWIGLVEVRALKGGSAILGDTKGAFVNIVTWAVDAGEYDRKARLLVGDLGGMYVAEVVQPEPVEARRIKKKDDLDEEVEEMISRAEENPNAIIYGTFHTYLSDDA
jgi:hypothetical protein